MSDLFRDSFFGHFLRLVTNGRVLHYPEELDPSIWQRYVNEKKSANMAMYGKTEVPEDDSKDTPRDSNSPTPYNENGVHRQVDSEKGRDVYLVDWYGPDDPEVCIAELLFPSRLLPPSALI